MSYTNNNDTLRVVDIVEGTSVDGSGLRTSIYVAGCDHRCPGCQNPSTWDFNAGRTMTHDEIIDIVVENDFNVTFSGGDPLYQIDSITRLAERIHALGKTIWVYTGFIYEEIAVDPRYKRLLELAEVIVDGPYIESLRDISLRFRGSSNQRLIIPTLSRPDAVVLYDR